MNDLKDKVAVVTGASRGIGRGIALRLADCGCNVAFNYQKSVDEAKSLQEEISQKVKCSAECVDVKDTEAVKEWIGKVKEELGPVDFLINNAGIIKDKPLMMMGKEDWQEVIDTNLNGMYNISRACIVDFMKRKSGRIVNISSVSGVIGLPGQTNYSASKGGMNAFTKALAKEIAKTGVTVNAIAPGFIETDILEKFTEEQRKEILSTIPLSRIGTIEDVANCVEFLLSDQARYITGQIIQIDGGLAIR